MTENVTYTNITLNGTSIALGGTAKASFVSPYNAISISFKVGSNSLTQFIINVAKSNNEVGPYSGVLATQLTNLAANSTHTVTLNINTTNFNQGSGTYTVGLYTRTSDGKWDSTLLFITNEGYNFVPSGSSGLEVYEKVQ